jgi:murein DD-endopeptidase MepM/ murein hydrolase activator NlpD
MTMNNLTMEECPMKKKQCVIAISCMIAGLIGFGGVYATERAAEKRQEEQVAEQQEEAETVEEAESVSGVIEPESTAQSARIAVEDQRDLQTENQAEALLTSELETDEEISPDLETIDSYAEEPEVELAGETAEAGGTDAAAETSLEIEPKESFADTLHFASEETLVWPLEGNVLLDYSMDATIYFPTLDQYRYNPAVIIAGDVNSKVYLIAKGIISDISTNEVTGCTVTENLGDGYEAVYGQLKELNFAVGDEVEAGQVIGYVSEPTKYYSVEGSNLYFELLKDGEPVNPLEYFD